MTPTVAAPIIIGSKSNSASGATFTVQLPNDAKLTVNGDLDSRTGTPRSFETPELAAGKEFYYDLRVDAARNGVPVTLSKRIVVRRGARVDVDLTDLRTVTAAQPATVQTASTTQR